MLHALKNKYTCLQCLHLFSLVQVALHFEHLISSVAKLTTRLLGAIFSDFSTVLPTIFNIFLMYKFVGSLSGEQSSIFKKHVEHLKGVSVNGRKIRILLIILNIYIISNIIYTIYFLYNTIIIRYLTLQTFQTKCVLTG